MRPALRFRQGLWSASQRRFANPTSLWDHLPEAPLDGNHATAAAYDADPSPLKVNLGRGVYKDDNGKDWVLPSVKMAKEKIASTFSLGHEYLPFKGLQAFTERSAEFAFGKENPVLVDGKIATVQTISGTGALKVGAEFLWRFLKDHSGYVYLPSPTYVNHIPIFYNTGFKLATYTYYDPLKNCLDISGFLGDIENAPERSVFLLHACAHNPTGIDPSMEQWKLLSAALLKKGHICFFDSAYQGFASGDPDRDAFSYRHFLEQGHEVLVAQSYAKNFGLYGERIGALNVTTSSAKALKPILSQLNQVIRPMYSNPPLYGARIVSTVFNDPEMYQQWRQDVKKMADRIISCRQTLVKLLQEYGSKRSWTHISDQIGMFAYSGLTVEEVKNLRARHIYLNLDGRMSMSGVNSKNIEYLAQSINQLAR